MPSGWAYGKDSYFGTCLQAGPTGRTRIKRYVPSGWAYGQKSMYSGPWHAGVFGLAVGTVQLSSSTATFVVYLHGYFVLEYLWFSGCLSPSLVIKFADVPNGLALS